MRGCDSGGKLMWSARSVGEKKGQKAVQVRCKNQVIVQVQLGQDSGGRRRRRSGRTISQESAAHDGPFEKASTQGPASPRHAS